MTATNDSAADEPDLTKGYPRSAIAEGALLCGKVGDDQVLLACIDGTIVAYGNTCPHLGAPLHEGLCSGAVLRCPWHHARFDLRTGEAVAAPAFDALPRWVVEEHADTIVVRRKADSVEFPARSVSSRHQGEPGLVIVGGGAAGYAAAHALRRLGHEGPVTLVSSDPHRPYDRTLLSKDYLDGKMGADRLPIARASLDDLGITVMSGVRAEALDTAAHRLRLSDGQILPYTKLLLATGAEPNRLDAPGADLPHVHLLRTLDDCDAILATLKPDSKAVVIGSSFIGLEAAASIRSRKIDVTVVTPESAPMSRKVGEILSRRILAKHTGEGVRFRLAAEVAAITPDCVELADGSRLRADVVVVGIGVKPRIDLAEAAGLRTDDGVTVDLTLQTSDPDVYAAGDIACWPDLRSAAPIRVEHWVVAQRQGEVAAADMLGRRTLFTDVPFFWSKHFDFSFRYVGHAEHWDDIAVEGDPEVGKAVLRFRKDGHDLAVITVEDDRAASRAAMEMERAPEPRG